MRNAVDKGSTKQELHRLGRSGLAAGCGNVKDSGFLGRIFITTNQLLNCLYHLNREDAQRVNHLIKKLEFLDDSQHQLGHCGLVVFAVCWVLSNCLQRMARERDRL